MPKREQGASELTHLGARGEARMVDITGKAATFRRALARCRVTFMTDLPLSEPVLEELLATARFAAVQAAKQTSSLVPLCHPIRLSGISVEITAERRSIDVAVTAEVLERTGIEMEALVGSAFAGLSVIAALRRYDPSACIEGLALFEKSGGRSGNWVRPSEGAVTRTIKVATRGGGVDGAPAISPCSSPGSEQAHGL